MSQLFLGDMPLAIPTHWMTIGVIFPTSKLIQNSRRKLLNYGSKYLSTKLKNIFACLNEFLISLQQIQAGWVTTPVLGDNRREFQPIFYNKNINFKKLSLKRGYIIPEDFNFKPTETLLSLRLTVFFTKDEWDMSDMKLKAAFGKQWEKHTNIGDTRHILQNCSKAPQLTLILLRKSTNYLISQKKWQKL